MAGILSERAKAEVRGAIDIGFNVYFYIFLVALGFSIEEELRQHAFFMFDTYGHSIDNIIKMFSDGIEKAQNPK